MPETFGILKVKPNFSQQLFESFGLVPTAGQRALLDYLPVFLSDALPRSVLLLRGYAGTGKTTLIRALVKSLWHIMRKAVLLAPTGRAAKVMAHYTGGEAHTIHRYIYKPAAVKGGGTRFIRQRNKASDTLFIIDEASMLSNRPVNRAGFQGDSLLHDLFSFVAEGRNCSLLFIGDAAQLPPLHVEGSPALEPTYLRSEFGCVVKTFDLTEVVRQAAHSGVLHNALKIRERQGNPRLNFRFDLSFGSDLQRMRDGPDLLEQLENSLVRAPDNTVVIVRSNKRAVRYNTQIRSRILYREEALEQGDRIMVVKNDYHWLPTASKTGFIANGDVVRVERIAKRECHYGMHFARAVLSLVDYPEEPSFNAMVCLDTLTAEEPALGYEKWKALYRQVYQEASAEQNKYKRYLAVKRDPYLNALQVKFAYALTCHKAQGGQWSNVFVEQRYFPTGEAPSLDYWRWLYTAVTRTADKLNLIGFSDSFFEADEKVTR